MTDRETRHAAIRDNAIRIAHELLLKEGEAAIQARRIAGEAGCSVGTLYNVFGSLEGLWLRLNEQTLEDLHARLEAALAAQEASCAASRATHACRTILEFAFACPGHWRGLMHWPVPVTVEHGAVLHAHSVSNRLRLELVAAALEADTSQEGMDAAHAADAVLSMVEGLAARLASPRTHGLCTDQAAHILVVGVQQLLKRW
jgi:AcrR family transcriptional regulator